MQRKNRKKSKSRKWTTIGENRKRIQNQISRNLQAPKRRRKWKKRAQPTFPQHFLLSRLKAHKHEQIYTNRSISSSTHSSTNVTCSYFPYFSPHQKNAETKKGKKFLDILPQKNSIHHTLTIIIPQRLPSAKIPPVSDTQISPSPSNYPQISNPISKSQAPHPITRQNKKKKMSTTTSSPSTPPNLPSPISSLHLASSPSPSAPTPDPFFGFEICDPASPINATDANAIITANGALWPAGAKGETEMGSGEEGEGEEEIGERESDDEHKHPRDPPPSLDTAAHNLSAAAQNLSRVAHHILAVPPRPPPRPLAKPKPNPEQQQQQQYRPPFRMTYHTFEDTSDDSSSSDSDDGNPTEVIMTHGISPSTSSDLISSMPGSGLATFPPYDEMRKLVGGNGKSCWMRCEVWMRCCCVCFRRSDDDGYERLD